MCADLGMDSEAERIFEEIKQSHKWCPDKWTYSSMIKLYSKRGKFEHAWQMLFEEMPQRGLRPDVTSYTSLIDCLGKEGRVADLVVVFDAAMKTVPSEIDDKLCCCLLSTMTHCKDDKEINAILACIEKANPVLHRLIGMLRDRLVGLAEIKEAFRELLNRASVAARRPYCNCLIDICTCLHDFPSHRSHDLFILGNDFGLFQVRETRKPSEWSVDLRRLSLGAARVALNDWFESVHDAVEDSESMPLQFRVYTGYGHDKYRSTLTKYMEGYFLEKGAPFCKSEEKAGSFVAEKGDMLAWLESRENSCVEN